MNIFVNKGPVTVGIGRSYLGDCCIVIAALFGGLTGASATPITVVPNSVFLVLDSESVNTLGIRAGDNLFLGANQVVPNGKDGTRGTAQPEVCT